MILRATKILSFDAAHSLPNYIGLCSNLHGHRWELEVEVSGELNKKVGMVLDFNILKDIMETHIIKKYDHTHLNKLHNNPTAENMVAHFVSLLREPLSQTFVTLTRVLLRESPSSFIEWKLEDEIEDI